MRPHHLVFAVSLALLGTSGLAEAKRDRPPGPPCEDGQYLLDAPALSGDELVVLQIADGQAEILEHCEATRARVRRSGKRVRLSARWKDCGGTAVKLKATLDPATCRTLSGTLRSGRATDGLTASKSTRVLVFTFTQLEPAPTFRHPSIADIHRVLGALPAASGIVVTLSEDPQRFTDESLAGFDVVLFGNTTGNVLNDDQQEAMERFIRSGKGFVGVHSAADTEYGWPWYGRLVGGYFISHPLLPVEVDVTTEDPDHPSTAHLPATFTFTDEIYNFDRNPRVDNSILLTIDEAGFIFPNFPPTPSMGADHPVAWHKEYDGGRSFYTNLGHRPESWDDPRFVEHLLAGIRWAAAPPAYSRVVVTNEASNPLALAVAPDGGVYYGERTGELRRWDPRTGRVTDAAVLDVDTTAENGLLGVVLDPDFASNRYVYLYHSEPVPDPPPASGPPGENVLSRFEARDDGSIDLATRTDLLRVPSERECCHEGGSLAFGPNRTLFLSTGDNTNPFESDGRAPIDERPGRDRFNSQRTAQNPFDLRGKILRINADGSIPDGNLFPADGSLGRPEVYVMGCRNPFRIAVDPVTGRLYWGDVGPDAIADSARGPRGYDEVNFADAPGNYGWPHCIAGNLPYADYDFATGSVVGAFTCDDKRPALVAYDYATVTYLALGNALSDVTGLTGRTATAGVVNRAAGAPFALPPPFADVLLMTEWTRDVLAAVHVANDGTLERMVRLLPWERFRRPIDLDVGPDGALWVLEYGSAFGGDNEDAAVSRIEYSEAGALTPVAVIDASVVAGSAPLDVEFSGTASRAPGRGDAVAKYLWNVDGDKQIESRKPSFRWTFKKPGTYPVQLAVIGKSGRRSLPAVREIVVGNTPPVVTIDSPADGSSVTLGTTVTLRGSAVDAEDGDAPCNELVWDVRQGHNAHSHPYRELRGCEVGLVLDDNFTGHGSGAGFFVAVELRYKDHGGMNGEAPLTTRRSIRLEID
jgi:glucose/arabinose dehydrogenase